MEKEKVVIIGANSFQNPLILKAKEKGYETHVFAWASGDVGEKTADYFYPISITAKSEAIEHTALGFISLHFSNISSFSVILIG